MRKKILILLATILLITLLFGFSSWTNAKIVEEGEISQSLSFFSNLSPLLAGVFVVIALAILVLIIFD